MAVAAGLAAGGCGGRSRPAAPMSASERAGLGGLIVFASERSGHPEVWSTTPVGEERLLAGGPANLYPGAASRDGRQLVIVAARDQDGAHQEQLLWLPLPGGAPVSLTAMSARARMPAFAPDGKYVVAEWGGGGFSDVARWAVPPFGESAVALRHARDGIFEPAISPDGTLLAYVSSEEGDPEVSLARADGTRLRRLTACAGEDVSPSFSPDGQWIAFLSNRERRMRAYRVRIDGTDLRPLVASGLAGDEEAVAFRPDGREALVVERLAAGQSRIWEVSLEAHRGAPRALGDGAHRDESPRWSPDGRAFVFVSDRSGDVELYLARSDGSGVTRLTHSLGADWLPHWIAVPPATQR